MWTPLIGLATLLALVGVILTAVVWWIKRGQYPRPQPPVTEWNAHRHPTTWDTPNWPYDGDY